MKKMQPRLNKNNTIKYTEMELFKYNIILNIVQYNSGIKDLPSVVKKRYNSDIRFVYFALCRVYFKNYFSLTKCSQVINRTHASVINGLKQFDYNYGKNWFLGNEVYLTSKDALDELFNHQDKDGKGDNIVLAAKYYEYELNKINVEYDLISV